MPVQRPAEIVNYRTMGNTPALLGAALAAGAVVALGLTLLASVRRRRRELALLKTLGFTRRQLAATVAWQASVAVAIGVLVGVPARHRHRAARSGTSSRTRSTSFPNRPSPRSRSRSSPSARSSSPTSSPPSPDSKPPAPALRCYFMLSSAQEEQLPRAARSRLARVAPNPAKHCPNNTCRRPAEHVTYVPFRDAVSVIVRASATARCPAAQ